MVKGMTTREPFRRSIPLGRSAYDLKILEAEDGASASALEMPFCSRNDSSNSIGSIAEIS
jgi:hypothetical protein